MYRRLIVTGCFLVISFLLMAEGYGEMSKGQFLALCYHAVPEKAHAGDTYSVSQNLFAEQMEYLETHGYHPVSLQDIFDANKGIGNLPAKPVLLTFDDAYISYYEFVAPLLKRLNYPSVLAVVGEFIESDPEDLPEALMNWKQIKEVSENSLVEVVSHTHNLHRGIQYNPPGNIAPVVHVLAYDPVRESYETEEEYREKIKADMTKQAELFKEKVGFVPRTLAWPFGKFNAVSLEIAEQAGFQATLTLEEGHANVTDLRAVNRNLVENVPIEDFIKMLKRPEGEKPLVRAVQVDLDLIYDPSYEQMDKNLGLLIDRLYEMKVNTVFLQAFADPDGDGTIESVYFYNRVLPVRADIFSHAAHQMLIRDMDVYAWMPTLSIDLPDSDRNKQLKVLADVDGTITQSSSWYRRLTPFSEEVRMLVEALYEDLAAHSQIEGVLFQDDAYLTDREDFHPLAVERYRKHFGVDTLADLRAHDSDSAEKWVRYKTEVLLDFTKALKRKVKKYRPVARFARNLYSALLHQPESEAWFAQDFDMFLKQYDYVVVMAYPQMEDIRRPSQWMKHLVDRAKESPDGIAKTIFKVQAYDWKQEAWIKDQVLLEEMRDVLAEGGRHIAYYPDNVWENRPQLDTIKLEMSTRSYPFLR
jgi:biofilm PGA synthesis lipoprotein PgaB